jgi:Xaa-Pro aminopeptidase
VSPLQRAEHALRDRRVGHADRQSNPDRVIQENVVLVVELYAGEVGADHGVKLGDEVLVTNEGLRILAPYPYSARLLP